MPSDVARDLGRHDAEIEALERQVEKLTQSVEKLSDQVASIQRTLTEARGGWKMLMLLGGGAALLGISLRELITFIWRHNN